MIFLTENFKKHLDLIVYQIYPRSFCDSNGDGIGDICGIISKLDYLARLGVNAVWLCPCYKSPMIDNGYDVADYRSVAAEYGTLSDLKRLIDELHKRDMKLIMDLVPNHTSDEHEWFKQSRKSRDNPYSDYYYWVDSPPNGWQSMFEGSAWEYDGVRGQYYLHSYAAEQPDLNWDNPRVVAEMQAVVDYWVDLGVDGFRIDVIDQISKDFEGNRNCFGPRLHEYINALFGREKTRHVFTVGECWCDDIDEIKRHCAESRHELVTLFQFDHLMAGSADKWHSADNSPLRRIRDILIKWQNLTANNDLIYSIFTDNHDNNFYLSRVGDSKNYRCESAMLIAAMFYLLKGVPFIYQGQEFGSVGSQFADIGDFRDVESVNYYNNRVGTVPHERLMEQINFGSRDNVRRPVAWNGGRYCGFSTAKPWIAPPSRAHEINLAADIASDKSVFRFYCRLINLRKSSDAIRYGDFRSLSGNGDDYFVYERVLGAERYTVVCNFDSVSQIEIPRGELILSNYNRSQSDKSDFRPYETAVYRG